MNNYEQQNVIFLNLYVSIKLLKHHTTLL